MVLAPRKTAIKKKAKASMRAGPARLVRWAPIVGGGSLVIAGWAKRDALKGLIGLDTSGDMPGGIKVTEAVTINRSVEDVYAFWRDFTNLPRFMEHMESVTTSLDGRSHWIARAPLGSTVEWDAELTDERPNEMFAWRSLPDAQIANSGLVRFIAMPAGRGVEVHVTLEYDPPAGALGALVAKMLTDEPGQQVKDDLRRFKQIMEAGEVATTDGQTSGRADEKEYVPEHRGLGRLVKSNVPPETREERRNTSGATDAVKQASKESFPASDSPGYTIGQAEEPSAPANR